jgi:hypothetical protein
MFVILRANQIYSQPGKPGRLPTGKSHFYGEIEPRLERVVLGPKAVGYTERSLDRLIEEGIDEAAAERDRRPRANADKHATKATAAEAR